MLDRLVPIRPLQLVVPMGGLPCQFGLLRFVFIVGSPALLERGGCCDDSIPTARIRRGCRRGYRRRGGWRLRRTVLVMPLVVGVVPLAGGGAGGGALPRRLLRCGGLRLRRERSLLVAARPPHVAGSARVTGASTAVGIVGVISAVGAGAGISITCAGGGGAHVRWAPLPPPLLAIAGMICAVIVVAHTLKYLAAATDQVRAETLCVR